jgi:RNA polymerase sigma-70 factor, ECF subfamily
MVQFSRSRYSLGVLRLLRPQKTPEPRAVGPDPVDPLVSVARSALAGDRQAQRTLFAMLGPSMLRVVRGVLGASHPDVEDVLQEAMMAVHRALPGFRGECSVAHFACRITAHTTLSARRRASYRTRYTPSAAPEELVELARDDRSPADARASAERLEAFRGLLEELPEAQAEALVLHAVLGYSVEETASAQCVPLNTGRSRLRKAFARLRERVRGDSRLFAILGPKP